MGGRREPEPQDQNPIAQVTRRTAAATCGIRNSASALLVLSANRRSRLRYVRADDLVFVAKLNQVNTNGIENMAHAEAVSVLIRDDRVTNRPNSEALLQKRTRASESFLSHVLSREERKAIYDSI